MESPFFSIITVVRNAVDSIDVCLDSVVQQNIRDLEHIVIDGASTDGTTDRLLARRGEIAHLVREPDAGIYDAMNKGLALARGRYVHFLNATDKYHDSGVLGGLSGELEEDRVGYGDLVYVDRHGRARNLGRPYSWEEELKASYVPQPTLFVPLGFYRAVGKFDLRYRIAADYEMFLRLASRYPVKYIPRPVTVMHAGGFSYQHPRSAFREACEISVKYGLPRIAAEYFYYRKLARFTAARLLHRI